MPAPQIRQGRRQTATPCPTPDKHRFATTEAAVLYATRRALAVGKLLTPYACDGCDWVHLTSAEPIPVGVSAEPALVNELRHATAEAFVAAVKEEAAGRLLMPRRIALRHPRLYGRWTRVLRDLAAGLDRQIPNAPAGSDWARRAAVYRHHLSSRLTEAEQLHRERKAARRPPRVGPDTA